MAGELLLDIDCIAGLSFGTSIYEGSTNDQIVSQAIAYSEQLDKPLIVEDMLTKAPSARMHGADFVVEGPISNATGVGLGSWGVLDIALREYMQERELRRPLLIAHARHSGRVAREARNLGMSPTIPEGLPTDFDKDSDQLWTRNLLLWTPREVIGVPYLYIQGKIAVDQNAPAGFKRPESEQQPNNAVRYGAYVAVAGLTVGAAAVIRRSRS